MIFITKQREAPHCQQTAGRHQMLFTDGKTKEWGSCGSGIDAYKGSIGNPDVEETLPVIWKVDFKVVSFKG